MKFEAVYHRTSDNLCYPLDEENLIINLKTGYDVERVFIYYGDPFKGGVLGGNWKWEGKREEICFKKSLKHHIWWTTTVQPDYKRCKYYFELHTKTGTMYYFEDGFYTKEQMQRPGKMLECFTFPWMNPKDINITPEWVNDTIWYQIFPERFCNGNTQNDPQHIFKWGENPVKNENFYGGDLEGITCKLDYLRELGITGIYMTPIFEAESSHKYDTTDYMKIDPHFGDEAVFKKLVEEAHKRGIRVMLDGVFNHCGKKFGPWLDVLENGPSSRYFDWFMINKWPFDQEAYGTEDGSFYSFAFTSLMPKLNTNNEEVVAYLLGVVEYWVSKFDIDGLRLDVANEVSHQFCKALRSMTKELKSDFYILGEIWHDAMEWLRGDEFDAVMNYPLASSITDFWLYDENTKHDFECAINHNYTMYMQQTNDVLFNLLDSHDTNRLITKVGDLDIFYQQLAVLYTMPGSPCIYYGTEIALEGKHDPDCRRCMPWEAIESGQYNDRIAVLKKLIALRKQEPTFKSRNFHFPNRIENTRVIEYIKIDDNGNKIEVLFNCSNVTVAIGELEGEVLFEHLRQGTLLAPKGILIRRI